MDVYSDTIRDLPADDKLRLVERIWDDLAANCGAIPLPDWAVEEAARRRNQMLADPKLGLTHEEVWKRIDDSRNG
jgi:putative addiction module component (TIGR02574 family)